MVTIPPTALTPQALKVFRARDEILQILDGLADQPTAAQVLTYAAATWAARMSAITGIPELVCARKIAVEIMMTSLGGVIPHTTVPPQEPGQ